ncbi:MULTISPECIES: metal-dependent hydrolase [unclassified Polaribacter]|uniref:metal-dependent hydrolase n=1 Tax=unclassified Polaribacter TaxID=196858 RepID=UPI0011BF9574|nr:MULTISPECIES: metal-dependent hydrolase [unclassified Polaribacter]TXD54202.1 metal-dependent hydrolase [Polaribacter sp. IC063]TXD62467.1 metal-dependent hydrolase [Polaribacter sp. IC066]
MASIFGHAFVAVALGKSFSKPQQTSELFLLAVLCAVIPDADVIGFYFDISYGSFWGHRGFSHSFVFALFFGVLIAFIFYKQHFLSKKGILLMFFFFLCTASHSILDAMTTGGKGVAFFSPFNDTRYFFSWRPIKVSPICIARFFSERGLKVIFSELIWIGIPGTIYILITFLIQKNRKKP